MNVVIISASHRLESNSEKIATYCQTTLNTMYPQINSQVVSLSQNPLPLWQDPLSDQGQKTWDQYQKKLLDCHALVVVTPEWHGMTPAGLKNFFLHASKQHLGHKPALLIGVSSGVGGCYPLAELRSSSYKNNRICYLPEQLIVRDADHVFNQPEAVSKQDQSLRDRLKQCLTLLKDYATGFMEIRQHMSFDQEKYPNGM